MYDMGEAFFFITTILIIKIKNIKHHNWHVPFCRTDTSTIIQEEEQERIDKRVAAGNHEAIYDIAFGYVSEGVLRLRQDTIEKDEMVPSGVRGW
jgi:hypothetical protein